MHIKDDQQRLKQAANAALSLSIRESADDALPIVDFPSHQFAKILVLFFQVMVVGIDSLRYFWSKKSPQEIAHDIKAIIKKADPSGQLPISLFGYSFGADILPFV